MSEEELKKICKEEFLKNIKENIKSETIFTYVDGLEKENNKQKEEINKLIAESTEWEERTYCWQDRAENLQIVLDKIKKYIKKELSQGGPSELKDLVNGDYILELLEEIE